MTAGTGGATAPEAFAGWGDAVPRPCCPECGCDDIEPASDCHCEACGCEPYDGSEEGL